MESGRKVAKTNIIDLLGYPVFESCLFIFVEKGRGSESYFNLSNLLSNLKVLNPYNWHTDLHVSRILFWIDTNLKISKSLTLQSSHVLSKYLCL